LITAPFEQQIASFDQLAKSHSPTDSEIDGAIRTVLRLAREHLGMDVAFVSQFVQGNRVFMVVEPDDGKQVIAEGDGEPLAVSFCQRVVDGRLPEVVKDVRLLKDFASLPATPFTIGAHLSTPIRLEDGSVFGTFCTFSFSPGDLQVERDHKRLRMAAAMVARLIDGARRRAQGRDRRWGPLSFD